MKRQLKITYLAVRGTAEFEPVCAAHHWIPLPYNETFEAAIRGLREVGFRRASDDGTEAAYVPPSAIIEIREE